MGNLVVAMTDTREPVFSSVRKKVKLGIGPSFPCKYSMNSSCSRILPPEAVTFLSKIPTWAFLLILAATVVTLATCVIFVLHVRGIINYVSSKHRVNLLLVLASFAPVTSVLCMIGLFAPRSIFLLSTTFIPLWLSFCLLILVYLVRDLFGGYDEMEKQIVGKEISLVVPPFCCVTFCCPKLQLNRTNIKRIELLVSQAILVRFLLLFVKNILFLNGSQLRSWPTIETIISVISMCSGLLSVFGANLMKSYAYEALSPQYRIKLMFGIIQLIVVICSLQDPIFDLLSQFHVIKCGKYLPAPYFAKAINHLVIICEMFFISLFRMKVFGPPQNAIFDLYKENSTAEIEMKNQENEEESVENDSRVSKEEEEEEEGEINATFIMCIE